MVSFLAFWDPVAGIFKSVGSGLLGALLSGLRLLFYFFAEYIYKAMVLLYDVFSVLCSTRLLDNDILDVLSARVGIVLGLFMLFYVIFSFIKMLIDPDQITDKSKGAVGIVKKILIVIVMLGVSSFCFRSLFSLQAAIVENHVVSKLFLPFNPDDSSNLSNKFGNILSAELFFSFYHVSDRFYQPGTTDLTTDWESNSSVVYCNALTWTLKDEIYENNDFSLGYACLNESVDIQKQSVQGQNTEATIIDFNWLFAVGIGIAVDYFLLSYCIAVGVRMIKLAVLEIISPMAFISYLSPKQDTMFSKWIKTYFSTYLDVFIRIGIINFAAFLCITIMDTQGDWEFWTHLGNQSTSFKYIIEALMVLALLSFAKKAPDLLKELGFDGGKFGAVTMKDFLGLGTALGATAGAGMELLHLNPIGMLGGAFRGGRAGHGAKNVLDALGAGGKAEREHRKLVRDIHSKGGSYLGYLDNQLMTNLGFQNDAEYYDSRIEAIQRNIDNEKEGTAMIRGQNEERAKAADIAHKLQKRGSSEIYTRDFDDLRRRGEDGDQRAALAYAALGGWQRNLNAQKARIEQMQSMGGYYDGDGTFISASAEDISAAKIELARNEDAASQVYADYNADLDFDHAMTADRRDLQERITANKNRAFDGFTNRSVGDYDSLHAFEGEALAANNANSARIATSDATIARFEADISEIKNSDRYRAAQAHKPRGN